MLFIWVGFFFFILILVFWGVVFIIGFIGVDLGLIVVFGGFEIFVFFFCIIGGGGVFWEVGDFGGLRGIVFWVFFNGMVKLIVFELFIFLYWDFWLVMI